MIIRNSQYRDGVEVAADVIDLDTGTFSRVEAGVTVETRALTGDEIAAHTPVEDPARVAAQTMAASVVASVRDAGVAWLAALDGDA